MVHLGWRGSPHGGLTTSFSSDLRRRADHLKDIFAVVFPPGVRTVRTACLVHLNPVAIDQHGETTNFREGQRQTVVGLGMASTILTRGTDNPSSPTAVLTGIRDSDVEDPVPFDRDVQGRPHGLLLTQKPGVVDYEGIAGIVGDGDIGIRQAGGGPPDCHEQ